MWPHTQYYKEYDFIGSHPTIHVFWPDNVIGRSRSDINLCNTLICFSYLKEYEHFFKTRLG